MDKEVVIRKIAEHYGITRNIDFSKFFNILPQIAVNWMKGKYNIYVVYEKCRDQINPEWLLSLGEVGEMLRADTTEEAKETITLNKALENTKEALARLADEQSISKGVLNHTERLLSILEEKGK